MTNKKYKRRDAVLKRKVVRRSPNISKVVVAKLQARISVWNGQLTWNNVIDLVEAETGLRYVRQSLYANAGIRSAYQSQKDREKQFALANQKTSKRSHSAATIAQLRHDIDRLTRENNVLIEKFARWLYNASARGLDERFLENPLPKIDRSHR